MVKKSYRGAETDSQAKIGKENIADVLEIPK